MICNEKIWENTIQLVSVTIVGIHNVRISADSVKENSIIESVWDRNVFLFCFVFGSWRKRKLSRKRIQKKQQQQRSFFCRLRKKRLFFFSRLLWFVVFHHIGVDISSLTVNCCHFIDGLSTQTSTHSFLTFMR